ncbi:hypothetical protein M408DRAFT_328783 [Serendipita vermifera MAFF 305830]|uniref:Uncharacterized protein n=1 Tax=Serendipita vermifera MAFF 305830 TaxID=933852 RepID=A0A0C3BDL8_SERVB|nr:hypothetical protein M408DRAFT_328783 [Serendipita vermifera MAFF 305830]
MSIPRIKGPYNVGLTYCKVPIEKRRFGSAKFKQTREPAFVLEEVAFQVFYPCESSKNSRFGTNWLDK